MIFYRTGQSWPPLPLLITSPTTEAMLGLPLVPLSPCGKERLPVRSDKGGWEGERCWTLWDPMDCSRPGSSAYGISQARILEWVTISFSRRPSKPGIEPVSLASPALAGRFFTTEPQGKPILALPELI